MILNRTCSPSVPFASAFLLLMVVGLVTTLTQSPAFMINSRDANGDFTMSASPPDFLITARPSTFILGAGSTALSTLTLTSLFGFSGNVTLSTSVHPAVFPWPSFYNVNASLSSVSVSLSSGGTATSMVRVDTAATTPTGYYEVWINGVSGGLTHQGLLDVRIGPYFNMSISPRSISVLGGSSGSFAITLVSFANFTVNATFQIATHLGGPLIICPPRCAVYPVVSIGPALITLPPFGTGGTTLSVSTNSSTTPGNYAITIFGGGCVCLLPTFTVTAIVANPVRPTIFLWLFSNPYNSLIVGSTTALITVAISLLLIRNKRTPKRPA